MNLELYYWDCNVYLLIVVDGHVVFHHMNLLQLCMNSFSESKVGSIVYS